MPCHPGRQIWLWSWGLSQYATVCHIVLLCIFYIYKNSKVAFFCPAQPWTTGALTFKAGTMKVLHLPWNLFSPWFFYLSIFFFIFYKEEHAIPQKNHFILETVHHIQCLWMLLHNLYYISLCLQAEAKCLSFKLVSPPHPAPSRPL